MTTMHNRPILQDWCGITAAELDLPTVRAYCADLESLIREVRYTESPQIALIALKVIARQSATIQQIVARRRKPEPAAGAAR